MHGSSTASWTAVLLALTGITVGGVALVPEPHWTLFIVGVVVTLAAGPVGKILSVAGLGANDSH